MHADTKTSERVTLQNNKQPKKDKQNSWQTKFCIVEKKNQIFNPLPVN